MKVQTHSFSINSICGQTKFSFFICFLISWELKPQQKKQKQKTPFHSAWVSRREDIHLGAFISQFWKIHFQKAIPLFFFFSVRLSIKEKWKALCSKESLEDWNGIYKKNKSKLKIFIIPTLFRWLSAEKSFGHQLPTNISGDKQIDHKFKFKANNGGGALSALN